MTRDKDLKRRVRARMAKTGEKYTAARAHIVGDATPKGVTSSLASGGIHGETAALRRLLDAAGVRDPRTGAAFSEAMLLGIGGGLGAAYFAFEYEGHLPTLYIGTRVGHQYPYTAEFATAVCERLGAPLTVAETGGAKTAARQLAAAVDEAGAALVWVALSGLPHWGVDDDMGGALPHVVVVDRVDGDVARVYDYAATPFDVPVATLASARARLRKAKHRVASIAPGPAAVDLAAAVRAGIATCVQSLEDGALVPRAAGNFGLSALAKWADLANDRKRAKGWPRTFGPGPALYTALRQAYFWIEASGTGGGGFRPLYAAFLDEAASILGNDALRAMADQYRALGEQWTALANALLPAGVAALARTRALLDRKQRALAERGPAGVDDVRAANAELADIAASMAAGFVLDDAACDALYADVAARLQAILDGETAAVKGLAAAGYAPS